MKRTNIASVKGRRVWDSRGRPTVEVEVTLDGGVSARAIAPAGASRGRHEAVDLRDGGERFGGMDVTRAISHVNGVIAQALRGIDCTNQAVVDARLIDLDGTPNKSRLGGNATVAVSMACLNAAAAAGDQPLWTHIAAGNEVTLPLPEIQIFGGGAHAGRRTDIQDFMIMVLKATTFREALDCTVEVYRHAGRLMAEAGRLAGTADEGGWWPDFRSNVEALDMLVSAIDAAGFIPGEQIAISLDVAASEFGAEGDYMLALDGRRLDSDGLSELLLGWIERYPILSVEDPFAEDDLEGWRRFTAAVGHRVQVVADDLVVTSAERIDRAAAARACNATLVKVNQAGTVTEARAALARARAEGWGTIVSARSGETEDLTIAHLAVGWNAAQIKVGSCARSERVAKWNELLRIEETLGARARFAGTTGLSIYRALP